jgi:uncharacterized membrane protein YkoI
MFQQRGSKLVLTVAMVAAVAVGGAVIANAASNGGTTTKDPRSAGPGPNEEALTGTAADKVTAAAKDKVPGGTVLRVETDSGSAAYEAHVRKPDGTEVVVLFDSSFNVTGVEEHGGRGPGDRDHGRRGPGGGETPLTGDTADKVTAAAKDKVPGGTVLRVETDSGSAAYEAHVRKPDGTEVVVLFNQDLEVTGVEDFGPPGRTP